MRPIHSLGMISVALLASSGRLSAQETEPAAGLESLAAEVLAEDTAPFEGGEGLVEAIPAPETGGLSEMCDRGYLRMAVPPDPLMIAFDGENAADVAMEITRELELFLAVREDVSGTPTVVVPTPMPRAGIIPGLVNGHSDFTTLTVSRAEEVDGLAYTQPLISDVNDVPILGPDVEAVEKLEDLAEIPIYVTKDSRYAANLQRLNERRRATGKLKLEIRIVDPRLDDYDLIELVEIGVIPATVGTDFKVRFWATAYPSVTVRGNIELSPEARVAWAMRSDNPQLRAALDDFAEVARQGTLRGNVVLERYMQSAD